MKMIGVVLGALVVGCLSWDARAQTSDHCLVRGVTFASCSPKARYFQAVVIAIPGWKGKCESTFGRGGSNLLNLMRQTNFFDVDCFDYDSDHTALAISRGLLHKRIEELRSYGYREIAFVTHSTGGVLALDLLLSEALEGGGLRSAAARSVLFKNQDGARLRALYTWAVPLNGIRSYIEFGGRIINIVNISPAVLPQLSSDSAYLKELKERIGAFSAKFKDAAGADRAEYKFDWIVLQGQRNDEVVQGISEGEPWFPSSIARVVNTASMHSYNVGDAGEIGAPRYPGEMMSDKAKLALSLYPRLDEHFLRLSPRVPNSIKGSA
jgi:hypothetical protein